MTLLKAKKTDKEKALLAVQNVQEENVRINVNVPKSFHKKIKLWAVEKNITVTELVLNALNEHMSK